VRSIRSRLLVTLLGLVTVVVLIVSLYIYNEVQTALEARTIAMEGLLKSQYNDLKRRYEEKFDEELYQEAWKLASQTYQRFEFNPIHRFQILGLLPTAMSGAGEPVMYGWLAAQYDWNWRSRYIKGRLDTIILAPLPNEYYQIRYGELVKRSPNLADDCLSHAEPDPYRLPENQPVVLNTTMACGKELRYVTVKLPVVLGPGASFNVWRPRPRGIPNTPRSAPTEPREGRRGPASLMPPPPPTMIVQVARECADRDKALAEYREKYDHDLKTVQAEAGALKRDLLNRLVLICIATVAGTALGITWISRRSLKPLVQLADAVSDVTPKDLRLKINGREPKASDFPEELEPIVLRLQESFGLLEHAFAREKRATADISHELRTPLASLMATAQVALRKTRTIEEYQNTLRQCVETGSHLATLVERLLMLSRLDAGVDQLLKQPVDVVDLAGQCVDMLRPLADQKHIEVELDVDDSAANLDPIVADAGKLREIFVNLIDNAVNYNKPMGRVTLRVAATHKAVVLEVSDTGIGMSPETRGHLFERFFRADASRQSETVNAGLGLAIVKGYVDLFGGRIEVESELGVGSTFRITLPRTRASSRVPQLA